MFYEIEKLLSDATVVSMQSCQDEIFLFDINYTLYLFNEDCRLTAKELIIPNQEPLHTFSKAISFAPHEKMMSVLYGAKPLDLLIDISAKPRLKHKIFEPRKTVEATTFSSQGNYFALGDASGRSHIFETHSAQLVTSLIPRPDYISCLEFSHNERFLVSCAYDKSVIVFDMVLNVEVATLKTQDIVESVSFYDDDRSFAMVQRNGAFQLFHMDERTADSEKNIFVSWPTSTAVTPDQRHLLVGLKNGSLCAVNLEKQELVFDETITNSSVTQIVVDESMLMIATEKSATRLIDMEHQKEEFINALKLKEHSKLKDMIGRNIFLVLEKDYDEEMVELFEPLFKKVTFLIQKGKIDKAKEMVEPYENDPHIMKNFSQLLNSADNIQKLAEFVKGRQFVDAFNLVEKYKILNETASAVELEYMWQSCFGKAKRLCKANDVMSFKKAETMLEPFSRVVSKQPEIHALLKNIKVYVLADDLVSRRKFKEYFALVVKAPYLANNEVHKNILNMGQKILKQLKQSIQANDFAKAKEFVTFLAPFSNVEQEFTKLKHSLVARIKFFDAIGKNDINVIFALAKENIDLRLLKEYDAIEEKFKSLSKQALELAFKADVVAVQKLFEPYKEVTLFEDKIASLVKIAYLSEMKLAAEKPGVNWEKIFTKFISYYGKSDDLVHVASKIGQLDVLKAIKTASDRYGYKKQTLATSIFS